MPQALHQNTGTQAVTAGRLLMIIKLSMPLGSHRSLGKGLGFFVLPRLVNTTEAAIPCDTHYQPEDGAASPVFSPSFTTGCVLVADNQGHQQ